MNRRSLLGSGAAALAGCASAAKSPQRPSFALAQDIERAAARIVNLDLAPGLSLAVYTREGVYAGGAGLADIGTGERVTADTAFYIASSTKSMTALALATLEARGELDLETTLADYAPDAPFPPAARASEARLHNLLAHTGGIANEPIEFRFTDTGQHDPDTLWRLLAASEPNTAAPLGRFQYANVGYNIATILTDRRLGVRWQDLLQREVFGPAGMRGASAAMSPAIAAGRSVAKPHTLGPAGVRQRSYLEKTDQTMHSAGGVIMTANDAARWLELMVEDGRIGGRQVIPAEVVRSTRAPLAVVNVEFEGYRRDAYGLGWYVGRHRDAPMLHHFGGFNGFRAHVSYLPEHAVGVTSFVNESSAGLSTVNAIANYVYDLAGGYDDAAQRLDAALGDAAARRERNVRRILAERVTRAGSQWMLARSRAAYVGAYENPHWGRIEINAEGDSLSIRIGVLRGLAEPIARQDSVWVEFVPGDGGVMRFEGGDAAPEYLVWEGLRFARAA